MAPVSPDVLDWPVQSLASAALSEFAPAQTFGASSFGSAPFILRAPVILQKVSREMRRDRPSLSGGMETKDDSPESWQAN
jgi:hypothetical protein